MTSPTWKLSKSIRMGSATAVLLMLMMAMAVTNRGAWCEFMADP
jgi:hypothetical protein